jgi:CP family cyanate transporter-like MFS transporter
MNSVSPSAGRRNLLLIAGILLIATTLRVTFTGAAPLLPFAATMALPPRKPVC